MPKNSKSYFGDYSVKGIGKVFGGKPSARTKRVTRNDYKELAGIMLPAMGIIAYLIYKRGQASSGTMQLTDKPVLANK